MDEDEVISDKVLASCLEDDVCVGNIFKSILQKMAGWQLKACTNMLREIQSLTVAVVIIL
jgi:hypothetical protein